MVETILTIPNENGEPLRLESGYSSGRVAIKTVDGVTIRGDKVWTRHWDDLDHDPDFSLRANDGEAIFTVKVPSHVARRIEVECKRHDTPFKEVTI